MCFEVYKDTVLVILGVSLIGYLPIHLCGMAIFAMLIHAFGNGKIAAAMGQTIIYLFLPGAIAALLFCNWTEYPVFGNFMSFHSFLFHAWIVWYAIMCYVAGDVKPQYKAMWQGLGCVFLTVPPIYIFNKLTGENYLFINEASEGSPLVFLWDIFGTRFGEPGYLLSFAALIIIVLHVLAGLYYVLGKLRKQA